MALMQVPVEISNKHIHLSPEHVEILFGPGHQLTPMKELSQPGQYACAETVDVVGPKGTLTGIRVLGPARNQTQLELATTDTFKVGVKASVRDSGDLAGTPGIELIGPAGKVTLTAGVIIANRHIHMTPMDAKKFGLQDGSTVRVEIPGPRGGILGNVLVRVNPNYHLNMHVDTDEGNAFNLKNGQMLNILVDQLSLVAR